jgi:hypothetical protein
MFTYKISGGVPMLRWCIAPILILAVAGLAAETYTDMLDGADLSSPDVQYDLGIWCEKNRMLSTANKHFAQALKLDPDHEKTRMHKGFLRVGEEWVHKSRIQGLNPGTPAAPGDPGAADPTGVQPGAPTGPAPTAADIRWNLNLWRNPDTEEKHTKFLDTFVAQLGSESSMYDAIATLMQDKYIPISVQRVATYLASADGRRILKGASMFCSDLNRKDKTDGTSTHLQHIQRLLPFLVKASEGVVDGDAIYSFCMVVSLTGEIKAVPRLIEIIADGDKDAALGARSAAAHLTLMPEKDITAESLQAWWSRNHALPPAEIYAQTLAASDPRHRLNACQRLYNLQDRRIIPVLADLLTADLGTAAAAGELLQRITGTQWATRKVLEEGKGKAIAEQIHKWWKAEQAGFVFLEFRQAEAVPVEQVEQNLVQQMVDKLDHLEQSERDQAFAGLQSMGEKIVPDLVQNLGNGSKLKQQKINALLQTITGQDFGYDPYGEDAAAKDAAIGKWRSWLDEKLMKQEGADRGPQPPG